ncbi:gp16a [Mycobacterium phage Che9c]|uniref:Uncharacterized protein n=1 Tax=Mycobacterium phage Che9c TaxID=2907832 RepID=Q854Y1_9CAUD|nr:gp16a [Mycobacterium phage Che9c]AAN12577.1 hypothetical protein PBI_CHE9C_16a [Mycobacterium phage Che9c]
MAVIVHLWTGEPEVGLWCPKCLLPSGYRVPLYHISINGISDWGAITKCHDCGGPL